MNRDPMDSFDKPFQSGDGLCYPIYAKNYYKTQTTPMFGGRKAKKSQKGGNTIGEYFQSSTPSDYPGNAYLSSPNQRNELTGDGVPQKMNSLTESFLNSNMGITYATQAGGGRKKNKRGGIGANEFNSSAGVMNKQNNQNSGTLNRAEKQQQSGGKNVVQEEMYVAPPPPTQVLSASAPSSGVFPIISGGKYKKHSKKGGNPYAAGIPEITESFISMMNGGRYKKYSKKGGNMPPGDMPPGAQPAGMQPTDMQPDILADMPQVMSGGRYKKYSKKGGNMPPGDMPPGGMPGAPPGGMPGAPPAGMPADMPPGGMPGMQPAGMQPAGMPGMTGGRYKKYSKKGGNSIFTTGSNFSSQPAGIDTQMAASGSVMSGGRKKSSRTLKGGVSDFATTLSSRGPINYPDGLSAQRFRYFNKTGTYIPNSQLQYAAAPISTGYEADPNPYPMAYNDYIGGGAKKKAAPKKKAPAKKKAAPAKKKAAPAKKKSASDKKKKSASDKKKK